MNDARVVEYVSSRPIGKYRAIMGAIRRAWKARQTGKPVKRLRRTIRQDARDIRWAHDVKGRDGFMCRKCGWQYIDGGEQAAHIVPRRYIATRRVLDNGLTLCHKCHRWAHSHETEFMQWVRGELDPAVLAQLQQAVPGWKGWRT